MKKVEFEEKTLTKRQLERQDFVDNEIFELLQRIFPAHKRLAWDIEMVGGVRDAIENEAVERRMITRQRFYPYIKI